MDAGRVRPNRTSARLRQGRNDLTTIAGVTWFGRPVPYMFDFLADPRNEPRYNPLVLAVRKTTPGAIGPGTRFVQRIKSVGGTADVAIEVVTYRRPYHLGFAIRSPGMRVRGNLVLDGQDGGCRVAWTWDFHPQGVWRLLGPLTGLAGRRLEKRVWEQMKRYVDATPVSGM